jgi:ribosomal protein S8
MKIETFCTIANKILKVHKKDNFLKAISELSDDRYILTIEKKYNKRSDPQNAYLWGVVYPIILEGLKEAGYSEFKLKTKENIEKVHTLMKYKFLKKSIITKMANFYKA